jgi:lipopolysaccharide/colanic/teichoic acid biosynthesis glycosyltransferase
VNSFARSESQTPSAALGEAVITNGTSLGELDFNWASQRPLRSTQSGLTLSWSRGAPEAARVSPMRNAQLAGKRLFDIVGASLALLVLLPLFIVVSIAIKATSRGPVFFRQLREGRDGVLFTTLKFRSMKLEDCDDTGVMQTQKDDPRISPIGRFLRRTSIDELPQVLNVIMGDMSLVGPRPHVRGMEAGGRPYRELVPYYDARLAMRPGITGWAQANGLRGSTADARLAISRIDHDIAYIQNFSLWLDVRTLIDTVRHEFIGGSGE